MTWFYVPPAGGSLPGGGTSGTNTNTHDDLSAQIDGVTDTFNVTNGSYVAGSLNISIHGMGGLDKGTIAGGNSIEETDPATGEFRVARALLADDAPLVAQYNYA